jgi:hypothetical protein
MATWEYIGRHQIQKDLVIRKTLSRTGGSYGKTYVYDAHAPEVTYTLETDEGLTDTEAAALEALIEAQDGTASVVDNAGRTWAGRVVGVSLEATPGSGLWRATLSLRSQADEV